MSSVMDVAKIKRDPKLKLVIKDKCSSQIKLANSYDKELFRQLADNIIEEYPEEYEYEYEQKQEDETNHNKPTFTFPVVKNDDNPENEPWRHLTNKLINDDDNLKRLMTSFDLIPNIETLYNFYYQNCDDKQSLFERWKLFDALNTILSDDIFRKECLQEKWQ